MADPVAIVETRVESVESDTHELKELAGAVNLTVERQGEILEGVKECQSKLEVLSKQLTGQTSDPQISMLMERVMEIQAELAALKKSISTMRQSNPEPPQSQTPPISPPPPQTMESAEPVMVESTVEPGQEGATPPKPAGRKRHVL